MKIRYKQTEKGLKEVAKVYTQGEHNIDRTKVDEKAVSVIRRLTDGGFETFLVGGAVRDLMLGLIPKDFDVVTEASPRQIHQIFRNSRIIGRRFKIVHVVYKDKIIEVSTFRSLKDHEDGNDNRFGTIEEDAKRRDFSINSFYYNPLNEELLDFNDAYKDFKQKKIRSLIPLGKTFIEDPVRMIRALKAYVITGFSLSFFMKSAIKRYSSELGRVSTSRLTEELNKILCTGHSGEIIRELYRYKLLVYILPCISLHAKEVRLYDTLREYDAHVLEEKAKGEKKSVLDLYVPLFSSFIVLPDKDLTYQEKKADVVRQIKILLSPNTPSNASLEHSAITFLSDNDIKPVKRKKNRSKKKADAGGGAPNASSGGVGERTKSGFEKGGASEADAALSPPGAEIGKMSDFKGSVGSGLEKTGSQTGNIRKKKKKPYYYGKRGSYAGKEKNEEVS